ncbi:MAG: hypothetical protein EPO22_09405 [Dehalococcoidia bacterium]|nr:MAG: hypothetical protein EPO22_09405 [Dehalococcoidia bacterium]
MRALNQAGARLRRDIHNPPPLSARDFDGLRGGALVIDARPTEAYAKSHVPNSLSIPFRDAFALWLGWLVPKDTRLLFVTGDVSLERVLDESLLVGYEQFGGVLEGGLRAWEAAGLPVATAQLVDASEARRWLLSGASALDVREPDEYQRGHVPDAIHVPLGQLAGRLDEIPRDRPVVAYCGHGERSSTAVSLLERAGCMIALNLDGGMDAWRAAGYSAGT